MVKTNQMQSQPWQGETQAPQEAALSFRHTALSTTADCYLISSKGDVGLAPKANYGGIEGTCILWQYWSLTGLCCTSFQS